MFVGEEETTGFLIRRLIGNRLDQGEEATWWGVREEPLLGCANL